MVKVSIGELGQSSVGLLEMWREYGKGNSIHRLTKLCVLWQRARDESWKTRGGTVVRLVFVEGVISLVDFLDMPGSSKEAGIIVWCAREAS